MRIVLIGGTGMVGGAALSLALADERVSGVTAIGRRRIPVEHDKLQQIEHADFADCAALEPALADHGGALFCLGAYTGAVPDDQFRLITVDYTLSFARALHAASPAATFCLLSGMGADQTEKSRMSFARYKGAAEKQLLEVGFGRVHLFRPGYIYPVEPRAEPSLMYRMMRGVYPALKRVYPDVGVSSEDLAWAMLEGALVGTGDHTDPILENRDIRLMAARR